MDDLAGFFRLGDPGVVEATLDGTTPVLGHFLNEYEVALGVGAGGAEFQCRAADLPTLDAGLVLDIDTLRYVAREVRPDGTGVVSLKLERQLE